MLWLDREPIGICIFTTAASALSLRSRHFGLKGGANSLTLQALNANLWTLSRVVLHPTYRGAGVASKFVRRACETCPISWIETLSAMGHINPFFERAGFRRIGVIRKKPDRKTKAPYRCGMAKMSDEYREKSRTSEPVYYLFDNRKIS